MNLVTVYLLFLVLQNIKIKIPYSISIKKGMHKILLIIDIEHILDIILGYSIHSNKIMSRII